MSPGIQTCCLSGIWCKSNRIQPLPPVSPCPTFPTANIFPQPSPPQYPLAIQRTPKPTMSIYICIYIYIYTVYILIDPLPRETITHPHHSSPICQASSDASDSWWSADPAPEPLPRSGGTATADHRSESPRRATRSGRCHLWWRAPGEPGIVFGKCPNVFGVFFWGGLESLWKIGDKV